MDFPHTEINNLKLALTVVILPLLIVLDKIVTLLYVMSGLFTPYHIVLNFGT